MLLMLLKLNSIMILTGTILLKTLSLNDLSLKQDIQMNVHEVLVQVVLVIMELVHFLLKVIIVSLKVNLGKKGGIMSLQEKVNYVKQLINLVCEVLPIMVSLIKEIVVTVQKIQTV